MAPWKTLQDVLRDRAKTNHPGRLLIYPLGETCTPREITYTALYNQAKLISRTIQSLEGFQVGHPVLLHFDDHWTTILWFWSVLFAGGLPVLSSPFSNVENDRHKHIKALSSLLEYPICFTSCQLLELFGNSHDIHLYAIEDIEICNCEQNKGSTISITNGNIASCSTKHSINNSDEDTDGDLAMLMLTSGSTGNAKAVQLHHTQVLAAVSGKASVRQLPPGRPFLNWIGLDHVAGLIEIHLQALWLGVNQIHVSAADIVPSPKIFLDLLSRHRVSRTFAPNFFLAKLVSDTGLTHVDTSWDLSNLAVVASGGEANDIKTCVAASALFERYGAPRNVITTGFGMTETCAGAIFNLNCPEYDVTNKYTIASVGKCMNGIEMRITTPEGLAASGELGDLEVRGPVVTKGYYHNQMATDHAFAPGNWFRTGDQGIIDSNGHLSLKGRAKDVININGVKMVASDLQTTIEQALGDYVERLVVFPSTASHTEQVTIAYVPKSFTMQDEKMVAIDRIATRSCLMATATCPFIFAFREQSISLLPTSTLGKISRLKTARLFEGGVFAKDIELYEDAMRCITHQAEQLRSEPRSISEAEAHMIEDVAETLNTTQEALGIHVNTSLFDVGFTSMHVIRLKYRLERRLGVKVSVFQIMKTPTVQALAVDLEAQLHKPICSEESPVSSYDPVIVFREKGSKLPLWLFHPGVGEVLVFVGLAQCLGADDRPVFALRASGFEPDQKPFGSIEQAVEVYATAIRRRQPQGPYALAGYSYGTMLAFETAKRLVAAGEEVRFLGSFNLPPHIKGRISQLGWSACLLHLAHFLGLITEDASDTLEADPAFCAFSRAEAMSRTLEISDKLRLEDLGLDSDSLTRWVDVAFGLQRIAADYDPSGQVNNIDVFHAIPLRAAAKSREVWLNEHLSRWADFACEPPRFHAVGGAHYTMIGPEHVVSFAETLTSALRARGV